MSPENFVYWLQGFLEICNPKELNEQQLLEIKNHLGITTKQEPHKPTSFIVKSQLEKENSQVYITVTNKPLWDSRGTHSYINLNKRPLTAHESDLKSFLINTCPSAHGKECHVVIDNFLNPSYFDSSRNLKGSNNHLVGLSSNGPGLVNIGTFDDSKAAVC
jgi:hypothetical protein